MGDPEYTPVGDWIIATDDHADVDIIGFSNDAHDDEVFESVEQAYRVMGEREAAANAGLTDEQRAITWGSKWVRFFETFDGTLVIFGDTPTRDDFIANEKRLGGEDEEVKSIVARQDAQVSRGYVFGRCYSVVVPDGEYGTTHVSTIAAAVTDEQFEQARAAEWVPENLANLDWFMDIVINR